MREIKFRSWDKIEKRMWWNVQDAYDSLHNHDVPNPSDDEDDYPEHDFEASSFGRVLDDDRQYIVMQFTGLRDKNGVEIYEGDILSIGTVRATVCWNDGGGFFDLATPDDHDMSPDWLLSDAIYSLPPKPVVIGNIYENPELLETAA